ncbi:DUF4230 domain-containing protein [Namhaeicola litoreus]|uniref:DUF4230 domain-containing protein n=1 Tax=Namhaeicola litoreus TaxID=1052145 RepID=A0ABW3XZP6_9FLAO
MHKTFLYLLLVLLGILISQLWFTKKEKSFHKEETQVILHGIENMSKLIVSEGTFSEVYNYENAKKYFYDTFEFKKSAIVTVNAKVQVSFDLNQLEVEVDSVKRKIILKKIPQEEVNIIPDVKYFDLQQSTFNSFTKEELNQINKSSIRKIRETAEVTYLQLDAKKRLVEELTKIYELSAILGWEVVDETESSFLDNFVKQKPKF